MYSEPFPCLFWAVSRAWFRPWRDPTVGVIAPLACAHPWFIPFPPLRLDSTLIPRWCRVRRVKASLFWTVLWSCWTVSLFILCRFLIYVEPLPCWFWTVSLLILDRFLVHVEPKPLMFILSLLICSELPSSEHLFSRPTLHKLRPRKNKCNPSCQFPWLVLHSGDPSCSTTTAN